MKILDTSGIHVFAHKLKEWISGKDLIVLVFALDNLASFLEMQEMLEEIQRLAHSKCPPFIIVGNKSDCLNKAISYKDGKQFAQDIGAVDYIETSCATFENIPELYQKIISYDFLLINCFYLYFF